MRTASAVLIIVALLGAAWVHADPPYDPHAHPGTGVLRKTTYPSTRGECVQCHPLHGEDGAADFDPILFTDNDNGLAFFDRGDGPCHPDRPDNYPLTELDRIPEGHPDAGYFEANAGGTRRKGVRYRGRWTGARIYTSSEVTPSGRWISPHAQDPDMPRRSATGEGLCLNCHEAHASNNAFDLLREPYLGIGGHESLGPPVRYALCFSCHGAGGPAGMDYENTLIADFYDTGLNGETAGHQIRMDPDVALSWPAHIRAGDMLPCYDCHNPHGSEGYNGVQPNGSLLSDQRRGWSGLTETLTDPEQARRFCLGCHIPADGIPGSQEVEGIVMNAIPYEEGHLSLDTRSCYDCHGADYSGPTGFNVHHPDPDPEN